SGKSTLLTACTDLARLEGAVVLRLAGDDQDLGRHLLRRAAASLNAPPPSDATLSGITSAEHRGEHLVLALDDLVGARRVVACIDDAQHLPADVAVAVAAWAERRGGSG